MTVLEGDPAYTAGHPGTAALLALPRRGRDLSGAGGGQRGRSGGADDGGDQLIGANQAWIEDLVSSVS